MLPVSVEEAASTISSRARRNRRGEASAPYFSWYISSSVMSDRWLYTPTSDGTSYGTTVAIIARVVIVLNIIWN